MQSILYLEEIRRKEEMKMSKDKKKSGTGKFVAGLAIGAGLGVLFAPKSGSETRAELKAKLEELWNKAKEIDLEDVKEYIGDKIAAIKAGLEDLDKEKVYAIAKEKTQQLKQMCEELFKYVIEKGTPVMEKTASAIREKASKVSQEVLDKFNKEEGLQEA